MKTQSEKDSIIKKKTCSCVLAHPALIKDSIGVVFPLKSVQICFLSDMTRSHPSLSVSYVLIKGCGKSSLVTHKERKETGIIIIRGRSEILRRSIKSRIVSLKHYG